MISSLKNITCGVPQGSTLGPLLFIIYMNDLVSHISSTKMSLYADDTAFFKGSNNIDELNQELSKAANQFKGWCDLNRLTLNLNKSKVMLLSGYSYKKTQTIKRSVNINIGNTTLELVTSYRYLGLIIDERLTYTEHLNMIKSNIKKRSYLLRKVRWIINEKDALRLYKSSIIPYFDLGSMFYCGASRNEIEGLQTPQNKCLKSVLGRKNWISTDNAHIKCNILKVKHRRQLMLLKYGHNLSKKPNNLKEQRNRTLRSNKKILLREARVQNCKFEKSYVVKAIKYWNSLPEDIKKIREITSFKNRTKSELMINKLNFPE